MFDSLSPTRATSIILDDAYEPNRAFRAYREGPNVRLCELSGKRDYVVCRTSFDLMAPRPVSFLQDR